VLAGAGSVVAGIAKESASGLAQLASDVGSVSGLRRAQGAPRQPSDSKGAGSGDGATAPAAAPAHGAPAAALPVACSMHEASPNRRARANEMSLMGDALGEAVGDSLVASISEQYAASSSLEAMSQQFERFLTSESAPADQGGSDGAAAQRSGAGEGDGGAESGGVISGLVGWWRG